MLRDNRITIGNKSSMAAIIAINATIKLELKKYEIKKVPMPTATFKP